MRVLHHKGKTLLVYVDEFRSLGFKEGAKGNRHGVRASARQISAWSAEADADTRGRVGAHGGCTRLG
jgi:hypothetical protein